MTRYRCLLCHEETTLKEIPAGKFLDDAWGNPKWFPQSDWVTKCCGTEDYDEIIGEDDNDNR